MSNTPKKTQVQAEEGLSAEEDGGGGAPSFADLRLDDAETHHAAVRHELERLNKHGLSAAARARWKAEADALPAERIGYPAPWAVLISEAYDVMKFVVSRWHARGEPGFKTAEPGLSQVVVRLPYGVTVDLVELAQLAAEAQRGVLLRTRLGSSEDVRPEAAEYVADLVRALTFLFDDGVNDDNDAQLAALRAAHEAPEDQGKKLAAAIEDYTALAASHRDALASIQFDTQRLDRAPDLVAALRVDHRSLDREAENKILAGLRNERDRFATLLFGKMRLVRNGAQFVFAKFPKVVREATSAYQRKARATRRAAGADAGAGEKDDSGEDEPT